MTKIYRVTPTTEQVQHARKVLEVSGGVAHRGDFDGDEYKQLHGLIGEIIIADIFQHPRPTGAGYDGGWDLMIDGKRYDVKTIRVNVPHKQRFAHNLNAHQIHYDTDGYILISCNVSEGIYEICGWITKEDFKRDAQWYAEGAQRPKDDGSFMTVKGRKGMYEIYDKHLTDMKSLPGWHHPLIMATHNL